MGDFNAHLNGKRFIKPLDSRGKYLCEFMNDQNMVATDTLDNTSGASSSLVSYCGEWETFIDHIIIPSSYIYNVTSCSVVDDNSLNVSRHRPIICHIDIDISDTSQNSEQYIRRINWRSLKPNVIKNYTNCVSKNTEQLLNVEVNTCQEVENMYIDIVTKIHVSGEVIPDSKFKPFLKPFWDIHLKNQHKSMKQARTIWLSEGRPRGQEYMSYREYKHTKCVFRRLYRRQADAYLNERNAEIDRAAD